jgi:protein phosphatase
MNLSSALEIASLTDPGRVRNLNEDCIAERGDSGVVVLADGMGGYNAGEVASGLATSMIADGLHRDWMARPPLPASRTEGLCLAQRLMTEHINRANATIYGRAKNDPQCAGMGTTLVAGMFYDDSITVAHIGDSRLYCLRGEELYQMTRDHSLLQEQIDSGLLTREQARVSHNKNLVTRALGIDPVVDTEIHSYPVLPEDVYLFCSDGLNDMVSDEELRLTLGTLRGNLRLAAEHLVQTANDNGGRDNVSVILVRILAGYPVQRGLFFKLASWLSKVRS